MIDSEELRAFGNHWLADLRRKLAEQFPGEDKDAYAFLMVVIWWSLLAEFKHEWLIEHLRLPLASAGYSIVKVN